MSRLIRRQRSKGQGLLSKEYKPEFPSLIAVHLQDYYLNCQYRTFIQSANTG